jgi:hypothetical protein
MIGISKDKTALSCRPEASGGQSSVFQTVSRNS